MRSNVIVTLEILHALIEKCPRDLPLFSSSILRVLDVILKGPDAALIEESVAVWEAFCAHYDSAQLSADRDHTSQYAAILDLYASYASKSAPTKTKHAVSVPVAIRHRTAGLRAIKALVTSATFAAEDGHICATIVPVILDNLYSDRPHYLSLLADRENEKQKLEKEGAHRRRQSTTGPRTTLSVEDHDPDAAAGTTEDVDQRAEEEVGVLALQSLRQVFSGDARGQIRVATMCAIAFAKARDKTPAWEGALGDTAFSNASWSCQLFEMICRWAAVQDRFIILVSTVESLVRSPIVEDDLANQLALAHIIRWLLHSNINFIGLSVMDVLVGLVQHILLLLQLGGEGSQLRPHPPQAIALLGTSASEGGIEPKTAVVMDISKMPSETRKKLLGELQQCIGDLATHVYYTDQIEDMVSAILLRLKPAAASGVDTTASAIQNPVAAADAIADSISLQERPHTDGFFSFDTARILALGAVRDIMVVANSRRKDGHDAIGRNSIDIAVWEGTQWLLRDPDMRVRGAYVEALLCWLDLELDKRDLRASTVRKRTAKSNDALDGTSRRAMSNASRRSPSRNTQSYFLQLLHLAIFDSAVEHAESEPDVLMLHLLLYHLTRKLGVNAVRSGLPVMYTLQDEIKTMQSPSAKVALGSLVYGYFWALSDLFSFDTSSIGRTIFEEINRRTQNGAWLSDIFVPPLAFDKIPLANGTEAKATAATTPFEFRPLAYREEIVQSIEDAYSGSILSPPSSPPTSPGRPAIMPSISVASMPRGTTTNPSEKLLPPAFRAEMLANWSRDDCIATAQRESTRSQSLAGSKAGSSSAQAQAQAGNGHLGGLVTSRSEVTLSRAASNSPAHFGQRQLSPGSSRSMRNHRKVFNVTQSNSSGSRSVVRVSHLKQVLAGNDIRSSMAYRGSVDDDDDDSTMMSADFTNDSFIDLPQSSTTAGDATTAAPPNVAGAGNESAKSTLASALLPDDSIPPVPLLPGSVGPQLSSPAMGSNLTAGINDQLAHDQQFPSAAAAGLLPESAAGGARLNANGNGASASNGGFGNVRYANGTGSRADLDKLLSGLSVAATGVGGVSQADALRRPGTSSGSGNGRAIRPPY